ncbi:cadmium resistance transporter [Staphylococcus saccharolyticus]|uniref:Cadmium resistance transporter n=1 Tax=Staphylococcus saccharolyticus TaxID=33028 RepID=A0A380H1Q6_9STAP|nr:cadmium resistance transporter [Staphylococcus saccharolyticus]
MFETIITSAVLYITITVDLLVILLIYFARATSSNHYKDIYVGQYLGSYKFIFCLRLTLCSRKMDFRSLRFYTYLSRAESSYLRRL